MLPSILHLKKIYEKRAGKVRPQTKSQPKLPAGFIHSNGSIVYRYFGKGLKHYGIFYGDNLTIRKETSFLATRLGSLYAVQIANGDTKICSISYRGLETVLHDGRGNDFSFHRTALLTLIGEVIGGAK